jgi:hypothetical protein
MGPGGTVAYVGPPQDWPSRNKDFSTTVSIEEQGKEPPKELKPKGPPGMRGPMGPMAARIPEETDENTNRQSGDWGVWLYYGKTMGYFSLLLAVFFVCVSTFASNFPSKFRHGHSYPAVN